MQRWLDHELEVLVNIHEVRYEYEKQSQVYVFTLVALYVGIPHFNCEQ